jgi:hypothetical protein
MLICKKKLEKIHLEIYSGVEKCSERRKQY